jgi:hypothetical protein
MRRIFAEQPAFAQRLEYERDVALLEVTNPAVHEFGTAAGSAFGKIVLLHQQRAVPSRGCVDGNAEARRASADDEKIPGFFGVLNLVKY